MNVTCCVATRLATSPVFTQQQFADIDFARCAPFRTTADSFQIPIEVHLLEKLKSTHTHTHTHTRIHTHTMHATSNIFGMGLLLVCNHYTISDVNFCSLHQVIGSCYCLLPFAIQVIGTFPMAVKSFFKNSNFDLKMKEVRDFQSFLNCSPYH